MIAVFGGGCFWCTEAILKQLKGVTAVTPGYAGGDSSAGGRNPTYSQVSSGNTGHAEVVQIEFDPAEITYRDLLTVFFASHDPTTPNQQGADVGSQYRSIILYTSDEQRTQAEQMIEGINDSDSMGAPVVTAVAPLVAFYPAEEEHKDFYDRNQLYPYSVAVISPKLKKVREQFKDLIQEKL